MSEAAMRAAADSWASRLSIGLLLAVGGASFVRAQPAAATQDRLAEARRLIDAGKPKAVLADLEKYVRDFPDSVQGQTLLGEALHATASYSDALDAFRRAARMPGASPRCAYFAARACDRLERLDEAFVWLDEAIEAGFSDWQLLRDDKHLARCRKDPRFEQRLPHSVDPKRPFMEELEVLHEVRGELQRGRFGWCAADVGDLDGDGRCDFAVGAPFHSDGAAERGKLYVYSGRTGLELFSASGVEGELFGWDVGGAGDVNGDGVLDLWVAAPGSNGLTGALYVLSGAEGGQLKRLAGQGSNDRFAESVCALGDLDGDGLAELCIAAPGNDAAGEDCGRVYVVSLVDGSVFATFEGRGKLDRLGGGGVAAWRSADALRIAASAPKAGDDRRGLAYVWSALAPSPPMVLAGDAAARCRAGRIAYVVDLDGDGRLDLFASDELEARPSPAASLLWSWSSRDATPGLGLSSPFAGDAFGRSFVPLGDLDGDGHPDFAVGAWRSRRGGPLSGAVTIHSGAPSERAGAVLARATGALARLGLGFAVAPLSDLDGDGAAELIVTAPFDASGDVERGRAWVIAGRSLRVQARPK